MKWVVVLNGSVVAEAESQEEAEKKRLALDESVRESAQVGQLLNE